MSTMITPVDRSDCIRTVERDGEHYFFHCGEQFLWEALPAGTRVIYPPPPLPALPDVDGAIEQALDQPLGADPLSAQLKPGMKLTIAFDDISLTLPPMCQPDIRQRDHREIARPLRRRRCARTFTSSAPLACIAG